VAIGSSQRPSLGPGDYFGEISLIDGKPRTATVTATTDLTTVSLSAWTFRSVLETEPEVAQALLQVLCARIRGTSGS
jgi:CRP-like cAMP-binding protein